MKKVKTWSEVVVRWECPNCEEWMEYDGGRVQHCPHCDEIVEIED